MKVLIYWQSGEKLTVYASQQHMRRLTDIISALMFNAVSTQLWYPQLCLCPRRFHRCPGARLQTQNIVFTFEGFFLDLPQTWRPQHFRENGCEDLAEASGPAQFASGANRWGFCRSGATMTRSAIGWSTGAYAREQFPDNLLAIEDTIILSSPYKLGWRTIYIMMFITLLTVLLLLLFNQIFEGIFLKQWDVLSPCTCFRI